MFTKIIGSLGITSGWQQKLHEYCIYALELFRSQMSELVEDYPLNDQELVREAFHKFVNNIEKPHEWIWHQYSIEAHTTAVVEKYLLLFQPDSVINQLLPFNIQTMIQGLLQEEVDGIKKSQLLFVAFQLHDIGKYFPNIIFKTDDRGNREAIIKYDGHERKSRELILNEEGVFFHLLKDQGYTVDQISYIADCAGYHFEFGHIRNAAKKTDLGYTLAFISSPGFIDSIRSIVDDQSRQDYLREIGLLFLIDNLGKHELPPIDIFRLDHRSEADITETIGRWLSQQSSDLWRLEQAFKQIPINIKLALTYLQYLRER